MQSSLWTEALAEGRQQGRLAAERELCRAMVTRHQPELLTAGGAVIDACQEPQHLERWILEAPVATPAAFAQLLGIPEP